MHADKCSLCSWLRAAPLMIQAAEVLRSSQVRFCTTLSKFAAAKIAHNTHRLREASQETYTSFKIEKKKKKTCVFQSNHV